MFLLNAVLLKIIFDVEDFEDFESMNREANELLGFLC